MSPARRRRPARKPPVLSDRMRIAVEPVYSPRHSLPPDQYVFSYFVRIENVGEVPAQLFWRHLMIHDPVAGDQEVQGEGVVGKSPVIEPGDVHKYESYCLLEGESGYMEGFYHFREADGSEFRAQIPRCLMRAPPGGPLARITEEEPA